MSRIAIRRGVFTTLATLAVLSAASLAQADIVTSGSTTFAEPNGLYTGVKSFTVYTHDDPGNPQPGAAGELTYVYTITNDPGSFLAIIGFNLDSPVDSVVAAGSIDDANLATPPPSAVINNNPVGKDICSHCSADGEISTVS